MTTPEVHPLYNSQHWAIPILLDVMRTGFVATDNHLIRFGILLWDWHPVRVLPIEGWDYEFEVFDYGDSPDV